MADVVNMVVGDTVVVGRARPIAPGPADRHAGVGEIVDVAVLDGAARGMADPDAHRRRMQPAAMGDRGVADGNALYGLVLGIDQSFRTLVAVCHLMDFRGGEHAASAEVDKLAPLHRAVLAAGAELDRVAADLPHDAAVERKMPDARRHDRTAHVGLGLRIRLAAPLHRPVVVGKREAFEPHVLHEPARRGVAAKFKQPLGDGRDDDRRLRRLTLERAVGERARRPVEIPRAGGAECLADIFHEEPVALGEGTPFVHTAGVAGEGDDCLADIGFERGDRRDRHA